MSIERVKSQFFDMTNDAVAVGFLAKGAQTAEMVYVNTAFTRVFGYEPEDVLGEPVDLIHAPETWPEFVETVQQHFLESDRQFATEARLVRANGERFWASISFLVVNSTERAGRFICATYRDISRLKTAEETATKEHERLVSALNAFPDPIVIYSKDLRLVSWNDSYSKAISDDPGSIKKGMHLKDVLRLALRNGRHPEVKGFEEEWIAKVTAPENLGSYWEDVEMPGDIHHRLLRSRSANGDYIIVSMNSTELVRQKREAEEARARLVAALNTYPAPFAIYDAEDRLAVWNDAYCEWMTDDPEKLQVGMHRLESARVAIAAGKFQNAIGNEEQWLSTAQQEEHFSMPVQDLEMAGDVHHRLLRSRASNGDLVLLRIDITEVVRQRRAAEAAQDRLLSAINAYPDPFAIYDKDMNLVVWNPAYQHSMTDKDDFIHKGISLRALLLEAARSGRIPAAKGRAEEWVNEYYGGQRLKPGIEDFEFSDDQHFRMIRSLGENGELLVLRMNMTEVVRQSRALQDYATKLELANHEVLQKALHDDLTGLGNRRFLAEKFQSFLDKRAREGGEIAALHVDLDRFKQINDTLGHAAGDKVLVDCSERIKDRLKSDDVVARIGGDEFIVLMWVQAGSDYPERLADDLLKDLSKPTCFEGKECRFGASIGIACTPLSSAEELLTNSDVALYKAKRKGRGQVAVFDRFDYEKMLANTALSDDVLRAVEAREFIPFYQPQSDAKTGEIVGIECLARWQHPERGLLNPGEFLSIATDLNVTSEIDRMVFERAIEDCGAAFADHLSPPSLSFNVSIRRVTDNDVANLKDFVGRYPGQICFELLETIFLEEEDHEFLLQLDRLRDLGISIEVDDFGSGRASVVALQRIGPERVKIDRRLVAPIAENESGLRMIRSIVEIGLALEMGVTAEGVETAEQAKILAELGCDRLQGYHIARPMGFEALCQFMQDRSARRKTA